MSESESESESLPFSNTTVSSSSHLTRPQLLKRRYNHLMRLSNCYKALYWDLMEHLKSLYRYYLCHYGLHPFKQIGHFDVPMCVFLGCNFNPMPLTSFCHLHILSDSNQMLYKPCNYVIKGAEAGPITCGKPILRSIVPALCSVHSQKAKKHLTRTFKRNSLNISSTTKMAPKFHVLVSEYVNHIQARRRKELRENKSKTVVKKENDV